MRFQVQNPRSEERPRRERPGAERAHRRVSGFGFGPSYGLRRRRAFTLIELILVMAMLSIVIALASPSLAHFFRGRGLDSEAKRFLALTRYAQSRAVSEGVPMRLWIDEEQRAYGLEAERSYVEEDTKAVEFGLGSNLVVEVELPLVNQLSTRFGPRQATAQATDNRPSVRFTPDGFISETSPDRILFRQIREGEDDAVLIGQSQLRLNYEILTNQPPLLRR